MISTLRPGGTHKKTNDDPGVDNNYYFEDYQADFIFQYLKPHIDFINKPDILDVCSAGGVLGKAILNLFDVAGCNFIDIKKSFWMVKDGDNYDSQDNFKGQDFLKPIPKDPHQKFAIIVINPPWVPLITAWEIYKKALTLLALDGVLFFIINNTFVYQGRNRLPHLKFQKYYLLPRNVFNTPFNRKLRRKKFINQIDVLKELHYKDPTNLYSKIKLIHTKIKQQILLDAGIMVYHNDGIVPNAGAVLKPVIMAPYKKPDPVFPGF